VRLVDEHPSFKHAPHARVAGFKRAAACHARSARVCTTEPQRLDLPHAFQLPIPSPLHSMLDYNAVITALEVEHRAVVLALRDGLVQPVHNARFRPSGAADVDNGKFGLEICDYFGVDDMDFGAVA
jgi:hypothetical protein